MPNGISCAYFAARNHIYGKSEGNVFKEGIAGIQTVRSVDAVTASSTMSKHVSAPVKGFFGKAASWLKKLVYPLIIASGVYNTVKSDDKVRTGASQAAGIGTMYAFEQVSEKALKSVHSKLKTMPKFQGNKWAKVGWYVLQGSAFVLASLGGYSIGSKGAEAMVDSARAKKAGQKTDSDTFKKSIENATEPVNESIFSEFEVL